MSYYMASFAQHFHLSQVTDRHFRKGAGHAPHDHRCRQTRWRIAIDRFAGLEPQWVRKPRYAA
jgi:hypothetical protein